MIISLTKPQAILVYTALAEIARRESDSGLDIEKIHAIAIREKIGKKDEIFDKLY